MVYCTVQTPKQFSANYHFGPFSGIIADRKKLNKLIESFS